MLSTRALLSSLLVLTAVHSARAEWIDPPYRPWKIGTTLAVPFADFSLHNPHAPAGTPSGDSTVTYMMTPSLVPSIGFGWRFINFGISKKLFNDSGPLVSRYGKSSFSQFRLGVNIKYIVVDFVIQSYKGLHTGTSAGNYYRPDLKYLTSGFNAYGGFSLNDFNVPYSIQAYYGSVEVPDGLQFDINGFTNLNWNSLSASSAIIPEQKAGAFNEVSQLKGFKSVAFNVGVGVGATLPIGDNWLVSGMAAAGFSFLTASQVFTTDNNYSFDVANQYGARFALLYRYENSTVSLKAYFDRWTQSIHGIGFRNDYKGGSLAYQFRF